MVTFYLIAYLIFNTDGSVKRSDNHLGYTTGPTVLAELKRNVQLALDPEDANVLILNVQFLSKEDYLSLGGHIQPGI
jgi:hypothetical protein